MTVVNFRNRTCLASQSRPAGTGARPGTPVHPGEPAQLHRPHSLPAREQEALLYAMARLAIDFVSGPGGIASALRRNLLGAQLNGKSVPLDVG
jgi:hypothetical protein